MYGTVVRTEQLTPQLRRVVLGGEGLADFVDPPSADAYVNAFFLPEQAPYAPPFDTETVRDLPREQRPYPRRYSVREWDRERRELTIDFVVHGDVGYAGRWATHAAPGDRLEMRGPAGDYSPPPGADSYLFVGDESAVPAIAACAAAVPTGRQVTVLLEVEDASGQVDVTSPGDLSLVWVHRAGRTDPDRLLAEAVATLPGAEGTVSAFVHGEAESIRAVRRVLLSEGRVAPEHLSCSPYWRRGHTDEQWRTIKRDWVREMHAEQP